MDNYRSVLFIRPEMGRDKIVWSVRFRRARRTIVRRAAKSGAEKAKTLNYKRESVRIPDTWARGEIKKMQKRLIISLEKSDRISSAFMAFVPNKSLNHTFIRFFGLRFFSLPECNRSG